MLLSASDEIVPPAGMTRESPLLLVLPDAMVALCNELTADNLRKGVGSATRGMSDSSIAIQRCNDEMEYR